MTALAAISSRTLMPSRWTLPANGERPSDRKHLIRVNSIIQNYDLPIKVWEMRAYEQSSAAAPDKASNATGDFWISSTGKTHKQGCRYYGQGKGRHAKKASGNDCKICGGAR